MADQRELRNEYRQVSELKVPDDVKNRIYNMIDEHRSLQDNKRKHCKSRYFASAGAMVAALGVAAVLIVGIHEKAAAPSPTVNSGTANRTTEMGPPLSKAENLFRRQNLDFEFASAYDSERNLISIRMLVNGKIPQTKAQRLLDQFFKDIADSYPNNNLSSMELLEKYNIYFEIADAKDKIDPLFYASKSANSTQIQWRSTPTKVPILNISEPVIPGTTMNVDGWVGKGIQGVSIQTTTSIQSASVQNNGYFSSDVLIPINLSQGTTWIELWANNKVILRETVSVANPYDPQYIIEAEHGITNHDHVNINQIHISDVKTLSPGHWLVAYKVKNDRQWVPVNRNYGVEVVQDASGQYTTQFTQYGNAIGN